MLAVPQTLRSPATAAKETVGQCVFIYMCVSGSNFMNVKVGVGGSGSVVYMWER